MEFKKTKKNRRRRSFDSFGIHSSQNRKAVRNHTELYVRKNPFRTTVGKESLQIPFSACRAKIIAPNAKFVVLLRDPAERAFSGFEYSLDRLRFSLTSEWRP